MKWGQTKPNVTCAQYLIQPRPQKVKTKKQNNKISMYCLQYLKKYSVPKRPLFVHILLSWNLHQVINSWARSQHKCVWMCPTDSRVTDPSWTSLLTCLWRGSQQSDDFTGELQFGSKPEPAIMAIPLKGESQL